MTKPKNGKRVCKTCGIEKPLQQFHWHKKHLKQRRYHCKECRQFRRTQLDAEGERTGRRQRQADLKIWYKQYKQSCKCAQCPEDHPATLHFHHLDPTTKFKSISFLIGNNYAKSTVQAEIDKCIVLCANCHAKLHWAKHFEETEHFDVDNP